MQSGRLRTSQLWFRIALARLQSVPYLTPILVIALVTTVVVAPKLSSQWSDELRPNPGPSEPTPSPSRRVDPTRNPVVPVVRTSTPDRTTPPPSADPTSRQTLAPRPTAPATRPSLSSPPPTTPTTPPTTEPTPTTPTPTPEPLILTATISRSSYAADPPCDDGATIAFTGTIAVSRTATVTSHWETVTGSSVPSAQEVTPDRKRTVLRRVVLSGNPGQTRQGTIKLIVSAPGATPVTATSTYEFSCRPQNQGDPSRPAQA